MTLFCLLTLLLFVVLLPEMTLADINILGELQSHIFQINSSIK